MPINWGSRVVNKATETKMQQIINRVSINDKEQVNNVKIEQNVIRRNYLLEGQE